MIGLKNPPGAGTGEVEEEADERESPGAYRTQEGTRRGSMAPCVAADEADGGVASQEQR